MADDANEWESLGQIILSDAIFRAILIDALMLNGQLDPGRISALLRRLHNQAIKGAGAESAAAEIFRQIRTELFGKGDFRLPAKKLAIQRERRRRNRVRQARGY